MNKLNIGIFLLLISSTSFCFTKRKNSLNSFHQEITAAFDEALQMINSAFDHSTSSMNAPISAVTKGIQIKDADSKAEISIAVSEIENADLIKAYTSNGRLKIIVPQKSGITKIIIDKTSIKRVTKQNKKQKTNTKELKQFNSMASKHVEYQTLPFAVDLIERTVEYKDDMLIITLNKAKEPTAQSTKAQPRIIHVTDK